MRVLQIITSLNTGGAEKLLVDSIPLYQEASINIDVLCLSNKKTPFSEKIELTTNLKGLTSKSIYNPFLIFKIIPYFKVYDIIHLHLFPTLYWVVIAKLISFSNVKLIYTEHSTHNKRRNKLVFTLIDRLIYKRLDTIVCISDGVRNELIKHLKFKAKIIVINNGINIEYFRSFTSNKSSDYFSVADFKLIQVSSFREQKDQSTVIRSLTLLPKEVKLILVGDGELKGMNQKLVDDLNLQNRVVFLGNRYDIPNLINQSDVVILSSNNEGFGLAIVEGMACGRPVIASDINGVRDIVENHGLLFKKGNEIELSSLIIKLMKNPAFYKKISNKCYNRAGDFDIVEMTKHYISQYHILWQQ